MRKPQDEDMSIEQINALFADDLVHFLVPGQSCKNVVGSSDEKPEKEHSWLEYWKKNTTHRNWDGKCAVLGCNQKSEHGAHIYHIAHEKDQFIVPMCASHNCRKDTFEFKIKTTSLKVKV